jgi:hypothetical protein
MYFLLESSRMAQYDAFAGGLPDTQHSPSLRQQLLVKTKILRGSGESYV